MVGIVTQRLEDIYKSNGSQPFLAPGAGFIENNFSRDGSRGVDGFRMIQTHYSQAHLLLCNQVANRPEPVLVCGPEVGDPCIEGLLSVSRTN